MLEKLSKLNKKWLKMAYNLCGDYDLSKDVVQEMYIKVYDKCNSNKDFVVKDVYIWAIIKNIIHDNYNREKKYKKVPLDALLNFKVENEDFELTDKELLYLARAKQFRYLNRGLLELNYDKSLREIAKETDINYGYLFKNLNKTRKLVLRDDYDRLYKNKRLKYKK